MRNIKLIIKFDGSKYHGWQVQNNGITVQQKLIDAIFSITGQEQLKLVGCGRTDAGVHALDYVANFYTTSNIPTEKIPYALNTHLPEDIVCIGAEDVDASFNASSSAKSKRYTYRILNSEFSDPFLKNYAYYVKFPLDVEKMQCAAQYFVGTHDFVGFAAAGYTVKTTIRTIYSLEITKNDRLIEINVTGNGFLYNMVRIIAGTLIGVGRGTIDAEDIPDIIKSCDRQRAGITAPAQGLCLSEVVY